MRILYFANASNSIHNWRFLSKMVQRGLEVFAVYHSWEGDKFTVKGTHEFSLGYEKYYAKGSSVIKMGGRIMVYMKFRKLLSEIKPDLVHAGSVPTCGFATALSGFHPFLLMPWGSDVLLLPFKNIFYKIITKFTIKRADMITCDAETVKNEIVRLTGYPPEKIVVFPWGIDLSLFKPDASQREIIRRKLGVEDKKVIIMNRSFKPIYGIEFFLKSLPMVVAKEPNTRVLLIGSGSLEVSLRKLVEELGLGKIVMFLGEIPNEKMPAYLNASDLYVSSSLSDGTSLSLLEAMACGLPVVVSDVPATLEWVTNGENGLVVPRQSIKELAEAIVFLLENEEKAMEMGKKNLEIARERADWDRNFQKLEQIYETLASIAR